VGEAAAGKASDPPDELGSETDFAPEQSGIMVLKQIHSDDGHRDIAA
jgi:hypothetical protein